MRFTLFVCAFLPAMAWAAEHPVLPVTLKENQVGSLRKSVEHLMSLSEADMLALIPTQSGLYFVSCANCQGGQQEGQLSVWDPREPDVVKCSSCGHQYPSEKYPMSETLEVKTPRPSVARFPYFPNLPVWWKEKEPYRHYFAARIDYHKIRYMERAALAFASLYYLTKEPEAARRAGLIMARCAEVYPSYNYHFDYPFRQKIIYEGDVAPADFRSSFRTARWCWWGYSDLSATFVAAYDLLSSGNEWAKLSAELGRDVPASVRQMLTTMATQLLNNRDDLGNMSPGMWANLISAGRVLEQPEWVHEAISRQRRIVREQFFYDGIWKEGAPSYHSQVVGAFSQVSTAARGYSDPAGYEHPQTGERFDDLDLDNDLPEMKRARASLLRMRLPNGRYVPVHDTWARGGSGGLAASQPDLLPGLGHGILGAGEGPNQFQAHLTWSPGLGHTHYDGLSLLLFSHGKELLSDLGYTHGKWREWTVLSPSHNLVVVDGLNQKAGAGTQGHLRVFSAGPDVQVVSVDNPQVYPDLTDLYRRTLVLVNLSPTQRYLVDFFEARGGQQHDYFLHGSADEEQRLQAPGSEALATLMPEGIKFTAGTNEQSTDGSPYHAYGYLRDLKTARLAGGVAALEYVPVTAGAGLQAFVVARDGDQLVTGRAPSIRQAGSDDSKLESTWRQFAMLRRLGGESLFAAVLAPHEGEPVVRQVRRVELPGARMALEVQTAERTDLIVLEAAEAKGQWQGKPLTVSGEVAMLGLEGGKAQAATVVAGQLKWGDLSLQTPEAQQWALAAVQGDPEPSLTVEGNHQAAPGAVITLDHGGKLTTAYTVMKAEVEGDRTRLSVQEAPGFTWDKDKSMSEFFTVPLAKFEGPHVVTLRATAHLQRRGVE